MELHSMSPSRLALQAAITAYANAERAAKDAQAAIDVQTVELQKSEAASARFSEVESEAASLAVARAKAKARGQWHNGLDPTPNSSSPDWENERKLSQKRASKQRALDQVDDDRAALSQLVAERDEAQADVLTAASRRADAIERVLAEEGAAILIRVREAERIAAALRAELMAMDGLHIVSAGKMRRVLADQSIAASRDIVQWLRAPLPESAPSHEQRSLWRAFAQALETDAEAALDDERVMSAAAAMPRPGAAFQPPQERWEDSLAAAAERAQAAQVSPAAATGTGMRPNAPAAEPRWEDTAAARAAWAQPQGQPMRYEDTPAYAAERHAFSGKS